MGHSIGKVVSFWKLFLLGQLGRSVDSIARFPCLSSSCQQNSLIFTKLFFIRRLVQIIAADDVHLFVSSVV